MRRGLLPVFFLAPALAGLSSASSPPKALSARDIEGAYRVVANVVYKSTGGFACTLDVLSSSDVARPRPTVVYIHGGGWDGGSKEWASLGLLPYLAEGFNAVNVEYRLAGVAPAPAAVLDVRCALSWVGANARAYGLDPERVVVTGHSAGGHLSLLAAMLRPSDGFEGECPSSATVRPAAVVNFFGVTDVADMLEGPNRRPFALRWLGGQPRTPLAARLSPVSYVRQGLPPILTVHGDADPIVPFEHARRLHELLDEAGSPNRLITVPGGRHGQFTPGQLDGIYDDVFEFLGGLGIRSD